MSQVRCFSQRLFRPFHGVMRTISIEHGDAETTDGVSWILYVNHEDIVSHTGMSEVRYGSWSHEDGLKLSVIRGTETNDVIDIVGEKLVKALEENAQSALFPLIDNYECWLLSEAGEPLALVDSVNSEEEKQAYGSSAWHPGVTSTDVFESNFGDALSLKELINKAVGRKVNTIWVRREKSNFGYSGDALTEEGEIICSSRFPKRMLLEVWPDNKDQSLVEDYLAWQSPWMLQLDSFDDEMRETIEQHAWKRPVLCAKQYQLFAKAPDEKQLNVIRVQARLMGYDGKGKDVVETFVHTGEKEIAVYVP